MRYISKICIKCQVEKPLTEFYHDAKAKDKHRSDCKTCNCSSSKKYQKDNIGKVLIKNKLWREINADHYTKWLKQYNPRKRQLCRDKYKNDESFRNKRVNSAKQYRDDPNNKERIRQAKRKLYKKYNKDPRHRLKNNLRRRLILALKGQRKAYTTFKLVGCSHTQLIEHIEKQFKSGMSWNNYGVKGWHVDHIKPCNAFDLSDINQQKECFHYTNLQPLWAKDNLIKGDKIKK